MSDLRRLLTGVSLAPLFLGASLSVAQAQVTPSASSPPTTPAEGSAPTTSLGEVVVTARKTTENVQKAPASIVAVSGAELQQQAITNPQGLEKILPSASLRTQGPVTQSFIRGVGSNLDVSYIQPAVAFVYNGVVIPRYGTTGLIFDLDSVQVISGPQGTLYGGTAAGGAININSAKPRNSLAGDGLLETGAYGEFHAAVNQNIPLGDKVSLRGAFDYERHDGYQTRGFDDEDAIRGRLSLLAKPTDDITALIFFSGYHDGGTPGFASDKPFYDRSDPYRVPAVGPVFGNALSPTTSFRDFEDYTVGANIEWRVAGNTFTYIPGFVRVRADYLEYTGGLPLRVHDSENQLSQELRWNRDLGQFKLSAGVFYKHNMINLYDFIGAPVLPVPPFILTVPVVTIPQQIDTSIAGYGQVVYSPTDRLRITAGVRYSDDRTRAFGQGTVGRAFLPFTFDRERDHVDWKVGVDYDLASRILVYANIQTGYVPFGYAPVPRTPTQDNYVPTERLLAFSGGFKSRFFDNKLEINNEFYYYEYRNFQAVDFDANTGVTTTLPARYSTIYGDEITVRALLPYDTELDVGANFMSAHYNDFSGPGFNYDNNQLIDAPAATVNAGLQHSISLGRLGDLLGRMQTHYESGHWGVFSNAPGTHQFAYTKSDFRLTYTPAQGRWSLQAYVNNIENQAVFGPLSPGGQPGPATGFLEPPRTYGVRFLKSWG